MEQGDPRGWIWEAVQDEQECESAAWESETRQEFGQCGSKDAEVAGRDWGMSGRQDQRVSASDWREPGQNHRRWCHHKEEALRDRSGGRGWQGSTCTHRRGERGFLNSDTDTAPWSSAGGVSPSYLGVIVPLKEETQQTPFWKQDSMLSWTVDFELYAQYLWKRHTNWKTRPPRWKSPRAFTAGP